MKWAFVLIGWVELKINGLNLENGFGHNLMGLALDINMLDLI